MARLSVEPGYRGCSIALCVALGGLITLVPRIGDTFAGIIRSVQERGRGTVKPLGRLATEHLGEEVIPPPSLQIIQMARARHLTAFAISPVFTGDALIIQRVTEGAWPIRLEVGAKDLFLRPDEPLPPQCQVQEKTEAVVYATCA